MKKFLKLESLTLRTPPEAVDRRVLAAAAFAAARRRWHRRMRRTLSAAAALLLLAGGLLLLPLRSGSGFFSESPNQEQLLALADWSRVEQDGYNLSCELNAGQARVSEMTGERVLAGL